MKLIKDCPKRTKRGRCEKKKHYCSFLYLSPLATCPTAGAKAPSKKGRKKK